MTLIDKEEVLTKFADYVGGGMSMNDYEALEDIVQKTQPVNLFLMFRDLCRKYEDIGLKIYIEFTEFGMILRGFWKRDYSTVNFDRSYSYELFEHVLILNNFDLNFFVDRFKDEFERALHDHEEGICQQ